MGGHQLGRYALLGCRATDVPFSSRFPFYLFNRFTKKFTNLWAGDVRHF
jgi:hypothetical protein